MQNARIIPARAFFLNLCLTLPAFGVLLALPAMAQTVRTDTDAATQTVPQTAQITQQPTDTPPEAAAAPLWANPADLVESRSGAISPTRAGETDILSCPFETLRTAYLSLYEETDALNVAALTSEVFKICIERQKQVKQLLDNEERLRAQLGDLVRPATIATSDTSDTTITLAPEPTAPAPNTPNSPETLRAAQSAERAQSALGQCSDRYTSGPVFGAATLEGGLHAFVFDAARGTRLTVKAGDALPGGLTIQRISTEQGVVISEQGVERQLARTLAAPAFDDGGGLLFTTVSLEDVYKLDSSQDGIQDNTRDSAWEASE